MRRFIATVAALGLLVMAFPITASAQGGADVSRTDYEATGLDGHPDLRRGQVLDLTLGRKLGAVEFHRVLGAAPDTQYQLVADIFFATACSPDDPLGAVPVPEGSLSTDERGNGFLVIRFSGDDLATAPDTFWVRWRLMSGDEAAYISGCVQVDLAS